MRFLPTSAKGLKLSDAETGVGVGRGKYDEHKGDLRDSATSLIWKDLKRRRLLPSRLEGRAVAAMVDYVRRGDLGEYIGQPGNFFNLSSMFQTLAGLPGGNSGSATRTGLKMLDALVALYGERIKVEDAVRRGSKFMTKWGSGVAVTTDAIPGSVSSVIAERGYALVILQHPSKAYLHVRATPTVKADLTALKDAVKAAEPDTQWYFHHSKAMLLHGDLVAPTAIRSRFTLPSMTKLVKKLYA